MNIIDANEAASILDCTVHLVYRLASLGHLQRVELEQAVEGSKVRFIEREVQELAKTRHESSIERFFEQLSSRQPMSASKMLSDSLLSSLLRSARAPQSAAALGRWLSRQKTQRFSVVRRHTGLTRTWTVLVNEEAA